MHVFFNSVGGQAEREGGGDRLKKSSAIVPFLAYFNNMNCSNFVVAASMTIYRVEGEN
jgi:hypothetical protein